MGSTTEIVRVAGEVVREGFEGSERELRAETASSAIAAREQAAVQARYLMSLRNPRDVERFRVALLKECRRPGFAAMAEYQRPVGKEWSDDQQDWVDKIATGPSVHLIRTAIALYQNMLVDSVTIYDSAETRLVHAYVLDLENNVSWARTIAISKVVEKKGFRKKGGGWDPPKDRTVISERLNSKNEPVYTLLATEDEVRNKEARYLAIAQRENGRSVLPRDIVDSAVLMARETIAKEDAADPDAALRKLIDAFAEINIKPEDLKAYLGHEVARVTPGEIKELRGVFTTVREGQATWDEILQDKQPGAAGTKESAKEVADKKKAAFKVADPQTKEAASDNPRQQPTKGEQGAGHSASGGQTESATSESTNSASDNAEPPSPEKKLDQAAEARADRIAILLDLRDKANALGSEIGKRFWNALGSNGCDSIEMAADSPSYTDIEKMAIDAVNAATSKDNPSKSTKPVFGKRDQK